MENNDELLRSATPPKRYVIVHNKIRCNHCGDVIESEYRHDFKYCKCGLVYVDGGHSYLRRGFTYSPNDYTELSETVEEPDAKIT